MMSQDEKDHLTRKEKLKQFRHEAYVRAKERRAADSRQIELKEKQKELRKEAYRKAKERDKERRDQLKEMKKDQARKAKGTKIEDVMKKFKRGSDVKGRRRDGQSG